jgi:hypothetical protein
MLRGFDESGMVLKLNKNLYGLCQAPQNWVKNLYLNFGKAGFQPATDVDPCLYISNKAICLVYIDDCIMVADEMNDKNAALHKLKALKIER